MDKENVDQIYNGILLIHKKKQIMPFITTWMDLEVITLREINQRKTNIRLYCLYVESRTNDTNEFVYKTGTDSQRMNL